MPKDIWKTKSQAQTQRAARKRTKVSENLELLTDQQDDEDDQIQNVTVFLSKLFTLLLAYTMAGSKKPKGRTPIGNETRTVKSCEYAECPLDVVYRYFFRVQDRAYRLPYHMALEWIQERDEAEREMWLGKFRNTNMTLGEVITETFAQREAMWEIPRNTTSQSPTKSPGGAMVVWTGEEDAGGRDKPPKPPKGLGKGKRDNKVQKGAKARADKLRDGTRLCKEYQNNRCTKCAKGKTCQQGKHVCAGKMKSGRVCGLPHPACECTNRLVMH